MDVGLHRGYSSNHQPKYWYSRRDVLDYRYNTSVVPIVSYTSTTYSGRRPIQHQQLINPNSSLSEPCAPSSTPAPLLFSPPQSTTRLDGESEQTTAEVQIVVIDPGKLQAQPEIVYVESEACQDYDNHITLACFVLFCCCCPLGCCAWRIARK